MELSKLPKRIRTETTGIDPGTYRLVAQRLNHCAAPGPTKVYDHVFLHNRERYSQIPIHLPHLEE